MAQPGGRVLASLGDADAVEECRTTAVEVFSTVHRVVATRIRDHSPGHPPLGGRPGGRPPLHTPSSPARGPVSCGRPTATRRSWPTARRRAWRRQTRWPPPPSPLPTPPPRSCPSPTSSSRASRPTARWPSLPMPPTPARGARTSGSGGRRRGRWWGSRATGCRFVRRGPGAVSPRRGAGGGRGRRRDRPVGGRPPRVGAGGGVAGAKGTRPAGTLRDGRLCPPAGPQCKGGAGRQRAGGHRVARVGDVAGPLCEALAAAILRQAKRWRSTTRRRRDVGRRRSGAPWRVGQLVGDSLVGRGIGRSGGGAIGDGRRGADRIGRSAGGGGGGDANDERAACGLAEKLVVADHH